MSTDEPTGQSGAWLTPTPVDDVGAPLRVPTRPSAAELDAAVRAPIVGALHTVGGVELAETTFFYDEARDLDVMVHLNGLTDAHRTDIRPALLQRVPDSSWYALTYLLPTDGTWSYRLVVRDTIPHDIGAVRAGWLGVHRDGRPDPLNADHLPHPHGEISSVFRGPKAPTRVELDRNTIAEQPRDDAASRRSWRTAELPDGSGLSVHFSPEPRAGAPLLVLFDAEQHLPMPLLHALSRYEHALDVVTLESGTAEQRGEVLPNPERAAARLSAVLDVLADQFGSRYAPDDVIVSGASYGGLAAAGLVVHHPELTRRAIAQSASYWYDPDREPSRENDEPGALTRCVEAHAELPHRQIIVQVGTDEGTMGKQAQMFVTAAEEACIDVRARQYRGGHDWAWWSHALLDGLDEIFASREG